MVQIGCDFPERREDETALGETGMGQREPGCVEDEIVDEKQIQIQGPRPIRQIVLPVAPVSPLGGEEEFEQGFRVERGYESDGRIDKGGLVCESNRLSAVKRGARQDGARLGENVHGGQKGLLRISGGRGEIRSQRNSGQWAHKPTLYDSATAEAPGRAMLKRR